MKKNSDDDLTIARSMIKKLIYFDIFSHPLSPAEILDYCNYPNVRKEDGVRILHDLETKNLVKFDGGFYFLGDDSSKVPKRLAGNSLADKRMKTAVRYARLIANFPYVRAVLVSGSLSKHVMKPESDIDFFIITEPGRLWACRAFLTLFKKVILGDSYRNFCLNYFIDTQTLEIPDKNIFTATEIAFLVPMYNYRLYQQFMASNRWYRAEFPNCKEHPENVQIKPFFVKRFIENLLNNRLGGWIDRKSYSIITGYWQKKFSSLDRESYALNFRSQRNVSKHHPNAFQEKVVRLYRERVAAFEALNGYSLSNSRKKVVISNGL
jgi:hypothetical protein